jgi:hypothetical protein
MSDATVELCVVRDQLDALAFERLSAPLDAESEALYKRLCAREHELLQGKPGPATVTQLALHRDENERPVRPQPKRCSSGTS